jgi:cathepsin L
MVSRIIILSAAVFLVAQAFSIDPFKIDKRWERYKKAYNKTYPSDSEEARRHAIWRNNTMLIMEHNKLFHANKTTFRLGMNSHADMTAKEFAARYNGFHKKHPNSHGPWNPSTQVDVSDLPAHVDWVNKGYVTPIKNQQQCGSCWAFSATGSMEGAHFKATGKLVSLSEQNLVDCSQPEGNMGCEGGLMDQAFQYVKDNGGIDTEASYPYEGEDDKCRFSKKNVGATDTGFVDVTPHENEHALKKAVATVGPVSVAIDASSRSFQFYKHGVYNDHQCDEENLDHGVLAVGYGTDEDTGEDYWIVKNSWGTTWGKQGFILMARNHNNQCGIATQASYPLV